MQFKNIEELEEAYIKGEISPLKSEFELDGQLYTEMGGETWVIDDILTEGMKALRIFGTETIEERIVLVMGSEDGFTVKPLFAKEINSREICEGLNGGESSEGRAVIGNTVDLKFPDISDETFDCKVDTGAGQCCLHAENIQDNQGGSIRFSVGSKQITMTKSGDVQIQSADGGEESRPVVKLTVEHDGQRYQGIEFNLNDRSDMPHSVLLGQNFLQAGNFLIDPLTEEFSEQYLTKLQEMFANKEDDIIEEETDEQEDSTDS